MKRVPLVMAIIGLALIAPFAALAQSSTTTTGTPPVVTGDTAVDTEVDALNDQGDPTALLSKLAAEFGTSVETLAALQAQGYKAGEIWLALEMAKVSGKSLSDVITLTNGKAGHGWGLVAKSLGIVPGKAAFQELKQSVARAKDRFNEAKDGEKSGNGSRSEGSEASAQGGEGKAKK